MKRASRSLSPSPTSPTVHIQPGSARCPPEKRALRKPAMRQSLNPQLVKYACQVLPLQRVYYVFHVPHTSLSMLSWSFTCHLLLWSGTHGLKIETVGLNASIYSTAMHSISVWRAITSAVCIWSGMFCHVLFRRYDCDFAIFHGNACSRLQGSASNPQLVAQTKWQLLANAGELLLATEHGQSTTNISTYFHTLHLLVKFGN